MALTIEQKKARRAGIGGSDAAAILGLSKWKTALDIFLEKTSNEEPYDEPFNPFTHWGNIHEPQIIKEFQRVTGKVCSTSDIMLKHPEYDFMLANLDARIEGENAILECKTTGFNGVREWGMQESDNIPEQYLIQCAHYAEVCDVDRVYIAVLIGGNDFRIFKYDRNHNLGNVLISKEKHFWNEHVLKGIPPEATNVADAVKLWSQTSNGSTKTVDNKVMELLEEVRLLKTQARALESQQKDKLTQIYSVMQESEYLQDDYGNVLASWRPQESNRLDLNAFKNEHPELYKKYLKQGTSRVFRLKGEK